MNHLPPAPKNNSRVTLNFLRKFAEIFASQGAPPVSTTPVANFATSCPCAVDTGGKFATGVNDAGGKLPPVSATPAEKFTTGGK
jgi:hypothetical protein